MNRNIWLAITVLGVISWVITLVLIIAGIITDSSILIITEPTTFGLIFGGSMGYISSKVSVEK